MGSPPEVTGSRRRLSVDPLADPGFDDLVRARQRPDLRTPGPGASDAELPPLLSDRRSRGGTDREGHIADRAERLVHHDRMPTVKRRDPSLSTKAHCSFCGKSQHAVAKMIAGPNGVYICDECVGLSNLILDEIGSPDEPLRSLIERAAAAIRSTRPELAAELDDAAAALE